MVEIKESNQYIEIYFKGVPDERIRNTLKICGWRWFSKKKCWSNRHTNENMEFAKSLRAEMTPRKEEINPLLSMPRYVFDAHEVIVRKNSFYCNKEHSVIDMAGEVEVCDKAGRFLRVFSLLLIVKIVKSIMYWKKHIKS